MGEGGRREAVICIVGVRRHSNAPYLYREAESLGAKIFEIDEVVRDDGGGLLRRLEEMLAGCTLHLSINMNVVDPAYAPDVNSPSPSGYTSREIISLIHRIAEKFRPRIVDIVE